LRRLKKHSKIKIISLVIIADLNQFVRKKRNHLGLYHLQKANDSKL